MADKVINVNTLEGELAKLEKEIAGLAGGVGTTDPRAIKAMMVPGKAIMRLDTTSATLARVNIALTVVILVVGILQLVLMARGH